MAVKIKVQDKLDDDTLDLSCSDLEDVPVKEIAAVKKGTHLDLSNNLLVKLPDTFVTLTHIVKLDLSKNSLEELPENIGDLKQLKHLDLYSNKITKLPLSFGKLKSLKWLDLKDNPLSDVLLALAGPCNSSEECQKCAVMLISYYNSMIVLIEKKKEMAKEAAANEEMKKAAKKRKNKKKKKTDATEQQSDQLKHLSEQSKRLIMNDDLKDDSPLENFSSENVRDYEKPKSRLSSTLRCVFSLVGWLIYFSFVSVLILAILPRFDQERSDQVVKYLETYINLPIKDYQKEATKKLDPLMDYAGVLINHTRILIRDTYHRHFGEELVDSDDADL